MSSIRNFLVLFAVGMMGGCASVPSSKGEWIGHVETVSLYGNGAVYRAPVLRIESGPEIPYVFNGKDNSGHGWLPSPILMDDSGRILDPFCFLPDHPVKITGHGSGLFTCSDANGIPLSATAKRDFVGVRGIQVEKIRDTITGEKIPIRLASMYQSGS